MSPPSFSHSSVDVAPNAIVQKPFKLARLAERVAKGLARRFGAAA